MGERGGGRSDLRSPFFLLGGLLSVEGKRRKERQTTIYTLTHTCVVKGAFPFLFAVAFVCVYVRVWVVRLVPGLMGVSGSGGVGERELCSLFVLLLVSSFRAHQTNLYLCLD